jgi:hypothetical protein
VRRYSWRSDKATEVGDILNELQLQRIQGHGKHKRNLWREAQQDKEPDSRANSHLNDGEYVSVITMYAPHRCVPTGREGEEDDVSLKTSSLTSAAGLAAALQRVSMKRHSNCGPSAKALASTRWVLESAAVSVVVCGRACAGCRGAGCVGGLGWLCTVRWAAGKQQDEGTGMRGNPECGRASPRRAQKLV